MQTKSSKEIARDIDENKNVAGWSKSGVYVTASEKTIRKLYKIDVQTGASQQVPLALDLPAGMAFSKQSDAIAVAGRNHAGLNEIHIGKINAPLQTITIIPNKSVAGIPL